MPRNPLRSPEMVAACAALALVSLSAAAPEAAIAQAAASPMSATKGKKPAAPVASATTASEEGAVASRQSGTDEIDAPLADDEVVADGATGLATEFEAREFKPPKTIADRILDLLGASLFWIVLAGLVCVLFVVAFRYWRAPADEAEGQQRRRRTPGGEAAAQFDDNACAAGATFSGQCDPLDEIRGQLGRLGADIDGFKRRLEALERAGSQAGSPPGHGRTATGQAAALVTIDRRNDLVAPPEDDRDLYRTQRAPAYPYGQATQPAAPVTLPANDQDLTRRYNEADSAAEMQKLAELLAAEYFANERSGDLSALIKSDVDRFWLIPLPGLPDEALLLPGFAVRKAWPKYRQFSSDHPLAHHFKLVPGDRFALNRAARLIRTAEGSWQLAEKGEVGGIT